MKNFGFIASGSQWMKGYVSAEDAEDAHRKILAGDYDDIIDSGGDEIEDVVELWEVSSS